MDAGRARGDGARATEEETMRLNVYFDLIASVMNVHIVDLPIAVYSARALHDDLNV